MFRTTTEREGRVGEGGIGKEFRHLAYPIFTIAFQLLFLVLGIFTNDEYYKHNNNNINYNNILKLHAIIISFPSRLRRSVLLNKSVPTSFLHWAIEFLLTLTTHERHFSFFNAFPLRSSALMPSVSPIRSAILRWKCGSRDTPSSCFFSFIISKGPRE